MTPDEAIEQIAGIKLDPCAHCGGPATVRNLGRKVIGHGESAQEYQFGCTARDCGVHILVSGRDKNELLVSLGDAIIAWNTRLA